MIYKKKCEGGNRPEKVLYNVVLNLAHEYYKETLLEKDDVRATKSVDFEGIVRHYNINISLYEPKNNSDKYDVWHMVRIDIKKVTIFKYWVISKSLILHQKICIC